MPPLDEHVNLKELLPQLASGNAPAVCAAFAALGLPPLEGEPLVCDRAQAIRRDKLIDLACELMDRLRQIPAGSHALAWGQIEETVRYLLNRREAAWWITFSTLPPYNLFWLMYYLK